MEKGGPDWRQPWGPTLQTMNLQVRDCGEANPSSKATSKYAIGKYATSKYANEAGGKKFADATKLTNTHQTIPPMIWLHKL